jgi:hypothetical protein
VIQLPPDHTFIWRLDIDIAEYLKIDLGAKYETLGNGFDNCGQ